MDAEREFAYRCILNGLPRPSGAHLRVVSRAFVCQDEIDPEELVQFFDAADERISRATIFRTLYHLVSVGMLTQHGLTFRRATAGNRPPLSTDH